MSGRKYAQRLQFECRPVTRLRLLFISSALLSELCVVVVPLSPLLKFSALLLIAAFAMGCWRNRCELGARAVTLTWDTDSRWWWAQKGEETELALCGDSYLSTGMVILNFRNPVSGRRQSLVLVPAAVGADVFRRLRVRLKLEGGPSVAEYPGHFERFRARFFERERPG